MAEDEHTPNRLVGDLTGMGPIASSKVVERFYEDALSPGMQEVGGLAQDTLKTLRLFTAPIQLLAAYQDRVQAFCKRVGAKVPDAHQRDAPPEIAIPVMQALASTSDSSPLMEMFEELMAKAIDNREKDDKLNPEFPKIIQTLSPLHAKLIKALSCQTQTTDDLFNGHSVVKQVGANFDFDAFSGFSHHLTLAQDLSNKKIVSIHRKVKIDAAQEYPQLEIQDGWQLKRTEYSLSMFGLWFADTCVRKPTESAEPTEPVI